MLRQLPIRSKIILPFIVIMAITSFIFLIISINFISKNIEKSLYTELDKQSVLVKKSMEDRFKKSIFYAQLISDMKKNLDKISNPKTIKKVNSIFTDLITQDLTVVYLRLNDIPPPKKAIYSDLINEGYQGKTKVSINVFENENQHLQLIGAAVGSIKLNGLYYPIVSEYNFNDLFLLDIKGKYRSDIALIFHGLYKNRLRTEILAGTPLFLERREIESRISQILTSPKYNNVKRFIDTIQIDNKNYKILLEQMTLNPQVYSAVVVHADDLFFIKRNIILATILAFILLTGLMMIVYFLIVRRIIISLETLTYGVQQVTHGDLSYQVHVESRDEIGELSDCFNQMVIALKSSTQKVIEEKERSEAIIANIPEGIIVTNAGNRLILANQMAEEMFQFSLDQAQGQYILECINHNTLLDLLSLQLAHPDQRFSKELTLLKEEKECFFVLNSSIAHNKANQSIGVITVLRDVTRDRELIELREGFLRTVSHELRTPLTSIIGFIDIIIQGAVGPTTKEQKDYLTISLNQALGLKHLISDLLDLSRMEAGKVKPLFSEIKLKPFLQDLSRYFLPLLKEKNNKLRITSHQELEMTADIEKIRRILINLIANANKFTDNDEIILTFSQLKDEIEFTIQDHGIGLKEDEKTIIFDKFRQVNLSDRHIEGIGLGLPIAKELVEMHHGKIWVESEYGQGATFKFTIPIKPKRILLEEH